MKLKLFLPVLIFLVIITSIYGQVKKSDKQPLAAYKQGNLWHFIYPDGNDIFPPIELTDVGGYSEGFFRVKKNIAGIEKICFLNMKGETAIVCDCDKAKDFSDGMAVIMKYTTDAHDDMVYGFMNKDGKQIFPPKFIDASDFVRGMAYILDKDKRGYIDKTGNYLIVLDHAAGSQFHEGMAAVTNEHFKNGFINKSGDLVIDYKFDEAGYFSEGFAVVGTVGKYGYVNKKGELAINPVFDYAMPFKEDRAAVGKLDNSFRIHWGFIDKSGNIAFKALFDDALDFSEGLSAVRKDRKWGFINKSGEYIIESKYSSAGSFVNGLAWVSIKESGEFGFIDKQGKYIIKIKEPESVIDFRMNKYVFDSK
ncbi:MAG: WG repeat-containing protein [Ignavibacteriae bacterium]|nr:WG repeat-containing protein [Ignavibacteriota bacterium]